ESGGQVKTAADHVPSEDRNPLSSTSSDQIAAADPKEHAPLTSKHVSNSTLSSHGEKHDERSSTTSPSSLSTTAAVEDVIAGLSRATTTTSLPPHLSAAAGHDDLCKTARPLPPTHFHASSFFGGAVCVVAIQGISFFVWKFVQSRTHGSYGWLN
ncbi:unnamed protein product, partial [Cyprideis torosa]